MAYRVLANISIRYPLPKGKFSRVTHPSATKNFFFVRLACVKHTASVHPELGSNSYNKLEVLNLVNKFSNNYISFQLFTADTFDEK